VFITNLPADGVAATVQRSQLEITANFTIGDQMKKSHLEEKALRIIKAAGIKDPVSEYRFCPERKWRADFAWVDDKVICEIEGGIWSGGSHGRGARMNSDSEKYNWAVVNGWKVVRYTCDTLERIPNDLRMLLSGTSQPASPQAVPDQNVQEVVREIIRRSQKHTARLCKLPREPLKPELAEIYGKRVLRLARHKAKIKDRKAA